jgi:hypothetical protein
VSAVGDRSKVDAAIVRTPPHDPRTTARALGNHWKGTVGERLPSRRTAYGIR